jgi:hypothetical protein
MTENTFLVIILVLIIPHYQLVYRVIIFFFKLPFINLKIYERDQNQKILKYGTDSLNVKI